MSSHPAEHGGGDYAAAIYGSIVATSLVGGLREAHVTAHELTLTLLATIVVFWLAHTWAAVSGERFSTRAALSGRRIRAVAREEWPLVEAGLGPAFALLLGWAGALGDDTAARLAIAIGVLQLFVWGFVLGRRVYGGMRGAVLAGLANGVAGLVLVSLEIAVSH